ncbi:MAG: hypothetical protein ACOC4F_01840 [bacterium]
MKSSKWQIHCIRATSQAGRSLSTDLIVASVLVVEDIAINQEIALELLARRVAAVEAVSNGAEALEALELAASDDARPFFDAVLMDVQMPVRGEMQTGRASEADRARLQQEARRVLEEIRYYLTTR